MKKIAIYGKGGIGKSTTVSNISAAFAKQGYKVMQIGCDPKADSTKNLTKGKKIPTVLDVLRTKDKIELEDIVFTGDLGVLCIESGGPLPGIGCAGRGIITAFEKLEELKAYDKFKPDIILYDVLGDVVCGGFAMPIRGGYADDVCIVTSGEMMSLYAASNICHAVKSFEKRGYASLKGFIYNAKNIENEDDLVHSSAKEEETKVIYKIDRNPLVQRAEDLNKTVVYAFPDSEMTSDYVNLANKLLQGSI
ncbi:AAA family ATPase [Sporosalibacterium faouarense]|uniref:AAA family ATPase n=1 Tax=Sporosalibacterium faouarense TaxID=516123 RepID=UPI00141CEEE2|nr:nitrogenase iron protein NifH [Sporosalibacterium faouarense]MTI47577.1 nitrogenase iron protein [Bacillota bacterium]